MSLLTRTPFEERFPSLQDQVNRLFGNLLGEHLVGRSTAAGGWIPAMDAVETPESFVVNVELPGVDPKQVDISVTGETLEIRGKREIESPKDDSHWYHLERSSGTFRRSVALPAPVDAGRVEANASNGLLTIRLPKRAEVMPKRIDVKVK